ncbi:MAG: glycosyl hydrolase [Balneolaceae bacterium]|nr:glycosyl hydrolase [Balneolaceae bacterium]
MDISRKEFIKLNALVAAGLPFIKLSRLNASADEIESLYGGFTSPPNAAKPFVRWWWNGNKVTKDEIVRELDLMKEAGIGGVEINSIKFPSNADAMGIPSHEWLSPEWIEMVETTVSAAEKRGITCDIIVGSGWPFGGRFLDKNEQTQLMTFGTKKLQGPQTKQFSRSDLLDSIELELHSKNEDLIKELVFLRLAPARMEKFTMGEDLSAKLNGDNITIEVPNGEYVLYYMVKFTGFQAVINGAPGADGPVLNHYNKDAVEKYLGRMSDNMESQMEGLGESFRAMFCDSLELEGANWTDDMLEEFERRRGYSLYPYLPFVLFKTGHMGNPVDDSGGSELTQTVQETIDSVRYDFYKTRLELFNERFIQTFNDWCHEHNVESRVQAYGRGFHPIESSMEIDIPECETWLRSTIGGIISKKLVCREEPILWSINLFPQVQDWLGIN